MSKKKPELSSPSFLKALYKSIYTMWSMHIHFSLEFPSPKLKLLLEEPDCILLPEKRNKTRKNEKARLIDCSIFKIWLKCHFLKQQRFLNSKIIAFNEKRAGVQNTMPSIYAVTEEENFEVETKKKKTINNNNFRDLFGTNHSPL